MCGAVNVASTSTTASISGGPSSTIDSGPPIDGGEVEVT
jgi:hypothetical protein